MRLFEEEFLFTRVAPTLTPRGRHEKCAVLILITSIIILVSVVKLSTFEG